MNLKANVNHINSTFFPLGKDLYQVRVLNQLRTKLRTVIGNKEQKN